MTVPDLIHNALRQVGVLPTDLLLCAVSGGGDSVSLTAAVHAAGYRTLNIAWINHNLRSSDETSHDREMVVRLAERLNAPVYQEELPAGAIESYGGAAGGNLERAARQLRYQALVEIANRIASAHDLLEGGPTGPARPVYLLTAHHRDDQTETVLSRISDGHPASVPLSIPQRRTLSASPGAVILVRPALEVPGSSLRAWGAAQGLQWSEDISNSDPRFRRNALRHQVVPQLAAILPESPGMIARFGSTHDDLLHGMRSLIPADAKGWFENSSWVVDREAFLSLPEVAQELILRDAAYQLSTSSRVDSGFIGEILRRLSVAEDNVAQITVSTADLMCVAFPTEIRLSRDIVPVRQRGYLWPVPAASVVHLVADEVGIVPIRDSGAPHENDVCVACTSIEFPAVLREQRPADAILWRGRRRTLSEVARREGVPRGTGSGAAVVESGAGIEAVFWRGGCFVVRDGGCWSARCAHEGTSAVIFRIRG